MKLRTLKVILILACRMTVIDVLEKRGWVRELECGRKGEELMEFKQKISRKMLEDRSLKIALALSDIK